MKYPNLEKLVDIIAVLRSENGCEWDREQTHKSLRPNMLEEAYEAVDAIDEGVKNSVMFYCRLYSMPRLQRTTVNLI